MYLLLLLEEGVHMSKNEETKKHEDIKTITELLMKEPPHIVSELLVFIIHYLSP